MSRFGNLEFGQESDSDLFGQEKAKDESYYFSAASTAFEEADFEKALRSYSKVLEFNPQNAAAWTGQVRALIELGEFREAKLWADKALERFPHEPELLAAKAVALGRCGDLDAAMAFSDAAIEERGSTPYVWLARGDVLLARRERRADWCFDKALALAPNNWLVAWLAARIRYFYQQFTLALRHVEQALQWNPANCVLWLLQGQCQQQIGWVSQATVSFQQALQLKPGWAEAQTALREVSQVGLTRRFRGWWKKLF